jgi:K+-transporting ATPase KdpF subunit
VRRLCPVLRALALSASPTAAFPMETIVISLLALGCLGYLVVAVLRPEKF